MSRGTVQGGTNCVGRSFGEELSGEELSYNHNIAGSVPMVYFFAVVNLYKLINVEGF